MDPDNVVDHYPSACSMCGAALGPEASVGHSARQVFDLPEPQPLIVTEHRAHDCQCACGAKMRAPFPDGVNAPVQYGVEIATFVVFRKLLAQREASDDDALPLRLRLDLVLGPFGSARRRQLQHRRMQR